MRKCSATTEKRIVIVLFTVLMLLCIGLRLGMALAPAAEQTVENRKAVLYDTARIPAVSLAGGMNINTASATLLNTLPGIGETLAARIVAHREEFGAFPHPASIMEVRGLGEKTYAKIADWICVK